MCRNQFTVFPCALHKTKQRREYLRGEKFYLSVEKTIEQVYPAYLVLVRLKIFGKIMTLSLDGNTFLGLSTLEVLPYCDYECVKLTLEVLLQSEDDRVIGYFVDVDLEQTDSYKHKQVIFHYASNVTKFDIIFFTVFMENITSQKFGPQMK